MKLQEIYFFTHTTKNICLKKDIWYDRFWQNMFKKWQKTSFISFLANKKLHRSWIKNSVAVKEFLKHKNLFLIFFFINIKEWQWFLFFLSVLKEYKGRITYLIVARFLYILKGYQLFVIKSIKTMQYLTLSELKWKCV